MRSKNFLGQPSITFFYETAAAGVKDIAFMLTLAFENKNETVLYFSKI